MFGSDLDYKPIKPAHHMEHRTFSKIIVLGQKPALSSLYHQKKKEFK